MQEQLFENITTIITPTTIVPPTEPTIIPAKKTIKKIFIIKDTPPPPLVVVPPPATSVLLNIFDDCALEINQNPSLIKDIQTMCSILPSLKILHIHNENHIVLKIQIKDVINNDNIVNWEFNRPPDLNRCVEIKNSLKKKKELPDWYIYCSYKNVIFSVYDGIHRIEALKSMEEKDKMEWLKEGFISVSCRINARDGDIINEFQNINKSVPVSELYTGNNLTIQKKDIVINLVNKYNSEFSKHFSTTRNPNIPNTNRDLFTNLVNKMYDKYDMKNNSAIIDEKLKKLNEYIANETHKDTTKYSRNVYNKCLATGCFLFLYKMQYLETMIENLETII